MGTDNLTIQLGTRLVAAQVVGKVIGILPKSNRPTKTDVHLALLLSSASDNSGFDAPATKDNVVVAILSEILAFATDASSPAQFQAYDPSNDGFASSDSIQQHLQFGLDALLSNPPTSGRELKQLLFPQSAASLTSAQAPTRCPLHGVEKPQYRRQRRLLDCKEKVSRVSQIFPGLAFRPS